MSTSEFALFGGTPAFDRSLPCGQRYFPSWQRYQNIFHGIFERQYYTEYGPLNQLLERKLQQFLDVKHAICVANETIGLMMLASAMELKGKVILPAFAHVGTAQSLTWAGLEPVFCDVNTETHLIDIDQAACLIDMNVSAIMGAHLWGSACEPQKLTEIAEANGVQLYFDATHAFGCKVDGINVSNFGNAEVFSFQQDNILNAGEGGCICTNNDELAAQLRTMRSSSGSSNSVEVTKTVNGRMSEAQCAIALMSLEDFSINRQNNQTIYQSYDERLAVIPGLHMLQPIGASYSNYQHIVCRVDEQTFGLSRDMLLSLLRAENINAQRYFYPGLHRSIPYKNELPQYLDCLPNTDNLSESCIQLPTGALVSVRGVEVICEILSRTHHSATAILEQCKCKDKAY